jgi:hypothetical protein
MCIFVNIGNGVCLLPQLDKPLPELMAPVKNIIEIF